MANDIEQLNDGEDNKTAARAYEICEEEGRPHGRNREHWEQAKAQVRKR